MIFWILVVLHVIACLVLIGVVLLQSGRAADLAGAFGGMGSQTAFGPRSAGTLLTRATTVAAVVFMVTSLTLSVLWTRKSGSGGSLLEKAAPVKTVPAPQNQGQPKIPMPVPVPVK